jgi:hypothetical protein
MTNGAKAGPCSGRLLRRVLLVLSFLPAIAFAQTASPTPPAKKASTHRANELTLAGLRPGRDTLARAALVNKPFGAGKELPGEQTAWFDACREISLIVDRDKEKRVQVIRIGEWTGATADCGKTPPSPWKTGLGLRVLDATSKAVALYGEPDSRSPSTRNGQSLELWYYAFDWAGENVPQVMEVLCTREGDGKPGRVVEITLAAPSL